MLLKLWRENHLPIFHIQPAEIQKAKQHFKDYIARLVVNSGHQKLLTDKELTEIIFMMLEVGIVAASIFKQADDLQSAKK